jgi:tRNA A-37 threonylcarbamoyl transferase component Bud32
MLRERLRMPSDTKPDDESKLPTTPPTAAGAVVPSDEERLTDSLVGAALGAGCSKPSPGGWVPPTPEELQCDFAQYQIRGILGRGGMGAVYKGWQRNLDRFVAIKILPPSLDDGISDFTERFKREAKAMAQLKHPGIIAVYDAGETPGGLFYFIMECVEGTDVQQLIAERGRFDPGEALRITAAVCDALACAHRHGVVHRDIKPSNIMLDAGGNVKVADFGLAKSTAPGNTALTHTNVAMGTPYFMAPEALKGTAHADHRVDLYAVGVMLYQMLTGRLPRGKYDTPSLIFPELDKRLDRIVDRALQPDPAARYSCAAEFCAAIDPVTRSVAMRAPANGGATASRKRPVLLAVAVAVAVIAALVHFAPWKKGGATTGGTGPVVARTPAGAGRHATRQGTVTPATANKDAPFVNTLGQEFVPVSGTAVLFCRWETRVKDYAAYAKANTVDDAWAAQAKDGVPVGREPEHPVCGVNWEEANAFCQWLTEKESAEERLPKGMMYRLPTDEEWSRAVGPAKEEGATPKERSEKNGVDFPWGTGFPPPMAKVGNYADSAFHEAFPKAQDKWIVDYTDGFAATAPAGSFAPNDFGIYDLGGNVWEWCEDWYDSDQKDRVLRGASWDNNGRSALLSSYRNHNAPGYRNYRNGFRCVVVGVSAR